MNSEHRDDLVTGFNQRKQLEIAVETAKRRREWRRGKRAPLC